jgi:hypothetical protein
LGKSLQALWKSWRSKSGNKSSNTVLVDLLMVLPTKFCLLRRFADFIESTCTPVIDNRNIEFQARYNGLKTLYQRCPVSEIFDIELIDKLIDGMAKGEAGGVDAVPIEHRALPRYQARSFIVSNNLQTAIKFRTQHKSGCKNKSAQSGLGN